MTPRQFVSELAEFSAPLVFNPWRQHCSLYDRSDAATKRRNNLTRMLEAVLDARAETIWIARDLGYRGGRRTGVALTDEIHLADAGALMGGISFDRATQGPAVAERTAAVVWRVLAQIDQPVMLWNVFPFHPHEKADPFSNRCHTRAERIATWTLLQSLLEMLRPRQIVAIGRDAQMALGEFGVPTKAVRHPSYGGQNEFMATMYALYGVEETRETDELALPLDVRQPAGGRLAFA
jgi:hypothetical protein